MPELPEVQTVRDGLAPVMQGHSFTRVTLNRADLRFAFAPQFAQRLIGTRIDRLKRRAKFLHAELSSGETLLMHLGMSGRFTIETPKTVSKTASPMGDFALGQNTAAKHDHVIFEMSSGARITYNDPRRFGFMELLGKDEAIERLMHLGPEPLGNSFNAPALISALDGKTAKIKHALLDQRVVAGLGNIYVCEALFRSRLSPLIISKHVTQAQAETLTGHIKTVLTDAIAAGGSTLKDFASADGDLGYFQHSFDVYGREGAPCTVCKTPIARITQGGRSTFYCEVCQP